MASRIEQHDLTLDRPTHYDSAGKPRTETHRLIGWDGRAWRPVNRSRTRRGVPQLRDAATGRWFEEKRILYVGPGETINWAPNDSRSIHDSSPRRRVVVNVYVVSRHYGGSEEGGWWYDWREYVTSIRCQYRIAQRLHDGLHRVYARRLAWGNISSVLGGEEVSVRIEREVAESESTETPHYE